MKKFKTQLFVSVSLFLCVILSFLAFAEQDGKNYFKNGTFENGNTIELAAVTGAPSLALSTDAADGSYSLKVSSKNNYAHAGIPISLEEGRKYVYSFDIKLISDGNGNKVTTNTALVVNFRFDDNGKKNHTIPVVKTATSTSGWHHVVGEYTPSYNKIAADADLENAYFCIYSDVISGSSGAVWQVDNLVLKRAPIAAQPDEDNYFKNGSFEEANNIEFVGITNSPSFSRSIDATDGAYSLEVGSTKNYAHIGFPIALSEGRTYSYSFDVKLISDGSGNKVTTGTPIVVNFRYDDANASGGKNHTIVATKTATSSSGWHHVVGEYTPSYGTIAADANLENANFCIYADYASGAVYLIDNVVLKLLPPKDDGMDNVNYFKNGSFEDPDNIELTAITGSPAFSQDLEASEGIYSLKVSSKSNYAHIGFPLSLNEGRTYSYSFDIKLISDGYGDKITSPIPLVVNFRFNDKNASGSKNHTIVATKTATSSSGWHHITGEYTPRYDKIATDADLENALFCIYADSATGATYLVDNVVLKREPLESEESIVVTPDLISDNMLIQKGKPIPIWGTTDKAEKLDIILYNGTTVVSRVSTDVINGEFDTSLPAVDSYYKKLSLVFEADGTALRTIENVAIGELWHFAGQSNMQSNATDEKPNIVPTTDKPDIHYYKVDTDGAGKWVTVTLSNIGTISAISNKTLETMQLSLGSDVPVGGLNSSIGGVRISRFMENGDLYNNRLVPISRIPIKGHFYYQGESDPGSTSYAGDLENMINDWRELWEDDTQPFIFVQLPRSPATIPDWYSGLDANGNPTKTAFYDYTTVHMQQYDAYRKLENDNVYMVVAIDITTKIDSPKSADNKNGEDPLHPRNKAPVAIRLANTALNEIYGKTEIKHLFPVPKDVTVDGKYIYIEFDGVYEGLETTGDVPEHFEIIDQNGKYHTPTVTEITSKNTIMLYCDNVTEPYGVCYFHEEHLVDMSKPFTELVPSLKNSASLPAAPFTYTITEDDKIVYSTISVPQGSKVYFADGSSQEFSQETEVTVPKVEGHIYVNTGFEAHTVYSVDSDGVPTKILELDDAILGFDGASIRTSGVQGIRFRSSVSNIARGLTLGTDGFEIKEYGFVVTAENKVTGLEGKDYELDMSLLENNKALKGIVFDRVSGQDLIHTIENGRTSFTVVLLNIPLSKENLTTTIASRPYYILSDGENELVFYGSITKRSVYDVAKTIKDAGGSDYINNKSFIDTIVSTVENTNNAELTTEIEVNVSALYE